MTQLQVAALVSAVLATAYDSVLASNMAAGGACALLLIDYLITPKE